jgi:hypothetical protein
MCSVSRPTSAFNHAGLKANMSIYSPDLHSDRVWDGA